MYDVIVIGKGLIGSAAAKYLAEKYDNVAIIGPDEPAEPWRTHQGVFASHYDQGRITRQLDSTQYWAEVAIESIGAYSQIETESGVRFYHQSGCIQVGPTDPAKSPYILNTKQVAEKLDTLYKEHDTASFREVVPALNFQKGLTILHEPAIAGYINPRQLIEAQLIMAKNRGAEIVREETTAVSSHTAHITITTQSGQTFDAQKVLVAAGGWTHFLLNRELDLEPRPRTILLAELSEEEAARLSGLPSIVYYAGLENEHLTGIYSLPPIRYPDGRFYLKIGGKLKGLIPAQSQQELEDWFKGKGSQREGNALKQVLHELVPSLQAKAYHLKNCVTTYTPSGQPLMTQLDERLFVAAGGCGSAAKSSDAIGKRAAQMLI